MGHDVVLAGPTLDRALALVRLGLLDATPLDSFTLSRDNCTGSSRHLALISKDAPTELVPILTPSLERPVHLLVADKRDMHKGSVIHHLFQIAHPHNSFMLLCPGVLAPAWPLYYALRCRDMPRLSDRLLLCMELCGTYSHLVVGDQSTSAFYRQPVRLNDGSLSTRYDSPRVAAAATKQELMVFLGEIKGLRGAHLASEALRYAR